MFIGKIKPRKSNDKQLMTMIIIIVGFIFIFFMMAGNYAKKIDVKGEIKINNSVMIHAEQSGVVEEYYKEVGTVVNKGDLLFKIKSNASNYSADSESSSLKRQLTDLNFLIESKGRTLDKYKTVKENEIKDKLKYIALTKDELKTLKDNASLIEKEVSIIGDKKERIKKLLNKGAISRDSYNDILLTLQQRLREKNITNIEISNKSKEIIATELDVASIKNSIEEAEANYFLQLDSLNEKKYALEKSNFYYIYAPTSGIISYSLVSKNQAISDGEALVSITKSFEQEVYAELYTDSQAMSYLGMEREVVVRVDAFPYEEFGILRSNIISVSPSKIKNNDGDDMFNVKIKLLIDNENNNIEKAWLKDGMTITATYSGPKLSLIEWLFLPAIKGIKRNPDFIG